MLIVVNPHFPDATPLNKDYTNNGIYFTFLPLFPLYPIFKNKSKIMVTIRIST